MLDKTKTDGELGRKVLDALKQRGIETPMASADPYTKQEALNIIERATKESMMALGLDMKDDSLKDTPKRVAKMYVNEIFWGLDPDNFPKITTVENKMSYNSMLIEKDISVASNCEHHLVPIIGKCHIAYIPNDKVIGLSKLNRIVEYFAKRPQIQERLTAQVHGALCEILGTSNVAVIIEAEHFCVKTRGVEDINSSTTTSDMTGNFIDNPALRNEFLSLIK